LDCIAPCREHTSKALVYGTHSQGISHRKGPAHPAFIR